MLPNPKPDGVLSALVVPEVDAGCELVAGPACGVEEDVAPGTPWLIGPGVVLFIPPHVVPEGESACTTCPAVG